MEDSKNLESTSSSNGETSERGATKTRKHIKGLPYPPLKKGNSRGQTAVAQVHTVHKDDTKY